MLILSMMIVLMITPFLCLGFAIIKHDHFYPGKSDFSSLSHAEDVQATLESRLVIGQSELGTTLAILSDYGVEECVKTDESVVCDTPTPTTILDWKNRRIRPLYLLVTEEDYLLTFHFENGKLDYIRVKYVTASP